MDVEIFTRDGCKSSRRAKDFLTRHGIGFVERNLSADADARAAHAQIGYRGVPVIRAEGHTIYGFREQALSKLLGVF